MKYFAFLFPLMLALSITGLGHSSSALPEFVYQGYVKKAEAGDVSSQFRLGILHEQGLAPDASSVTALGWYTKAADAGYMPALKKVISTLKKAPNSNENSVQLIKYMTQAAELGVVDEIFNLAVFHEQGKHVNRDIVKAKALYQQAAEAGLVKAMRHLGILLWQENASSGALEDAKEWLTRASLSGDDIATNLLAKLPENMEE